ncbi:MAG TPA: protein kinase family protein [Mycobacteriales bacterium]|nr:protein kinase family protein [Mycobacteriales bacterium]
MVEADPGTATGRSAPTVLGGRYRLVRRVATDRTGATTLWEAADEVLARRVAVRVLAGGTSAAANELREAFLAAAADAGRVADPRVAAVYDAATAQGPKGRTIAYVVSEWAEGRPLSRMLEEGPLAPPIAARVLESVCAAVQALHSAGTFHGALHPGQVVLPVLEGSSQPLVKVTDAVIAATVAGGVAGVPPCATNPIGRDTAALGRILYATLTGRWPVGFDPPGTAVPGVPDWEGLPIEAPTGDRLRLPRRVRAGLPREADSVVARVLDPVQRPGQDPIRTPSALAAALAPLRVLPPEEEETESRMARLRRGPARFVVPIGLLVGIAALGWVLGLVVGRVPGTSSGSKTPAPSAGASAPASASASAGASIDLSSATITAFDPPPGDGAEDNVGVPLATDGDPTTGWSTEQYTGGPTFGGLKKGVGLLVDLGTPTSVREVDLTLSGNGDTTAQLLAAPDATTTPTTLDGFTKLVEQSGPTGVTLTATAPVTSRYFLVWLTSIPQSTEDPSKWQGTIDEMTFLS